MVSFFYFIYCVELILFLPLISFSFWDFPIGSSVTWSVVLCQRSSFRMTVQRNRKAVGDHFLGCTAVSSEISNVACNGEKLWPPRLFVFTFISTIPYHLSFYSCFLLRYQATFRPELNPLSAKIKGKQPSRTEYKNTKILERSGDPLYLRLLVLFHYSLRPRRAGIYKWNVS